jgi:hypothetical protein
VGEPATKLGHHLQFLAIANAPLVRQPLHPQRLRGGKSPWRQRPADPRFPKFAVLFTDYSRLLEVQACQLARPGAIGR